MVDLTCAILPKRQTCACLDLGSRQLSSFSRIPHSYILGTIVSSTPILLYKVTQPFAAAISRALGWVRVIGRWYWVQNWTRKENGRSRSRTLPYLYIMVRQNDVIAIIIVGLFVAVFLVLCYVRLSQPSLARPPPMNGAMPPPHVNGAMPPSPPDTDTVDDLEDDRYRERDDIGHRLALEMPELARLRRER